MEQEILYSHSGDKDYNANLYGEFNPDGTVTDGKLIIARQAIPEIDRPAFLVEESFTGTIEECDAYVVEQIKQLPE